MDTEKILDLIEKGIAASVAEDEKKYPDYSHNIDFMRYDEASWYLSLKQNIYK